MVRIYHGEGGGRKRKGWNGVYLSSSKKGEMRKGFPEWGLNSTWGVGEGGGGGKGHPQIKKKTTFYRGRLRLSQG